MKCVCGHDEEEHTSSGCVQSVVCGCPISVEDVEVYVLRARIAAMREALERIRDKAKSWEGREKAPYWNLGDIAAAALLKESEE